MGGTNQEGVSAGPPPTADPQDPLPESNWTWRRVLVLAGGVIQAAGLGVILAMLYSIAKAALAALKADPANAATILLSAIEALYNLGWWLIALLILDRILYLVAPSAEQVSKMLLTVSAWRSGVSTALAARVATHAGVAETSTVAGQELTRGPYPVRHLLDTAKPAPTSEATVPMLDDDDGLPEQPQWQR